MPNVLICEDDAAIGMLLETLVRRHRADVYRANSGKAAIELLSERRYSAVLLDLMMPAISGYDVLDHIRERMPDLLPRLLVVSAYPAAMKNPPTDVGGFFSKPFDVVELSNRVAVLLDSDRG